MQQQGHESQQTRESSGKARSRFLLQTPEIAQPVRPRIQRDGPEGTAEEEVVPAPSVRVAFDSLEDGVTYRAPDKPTNPVRIRRVGEQLVVTFSSGLLANREADVLPREPDLHITFVNLTQGGISVLMEGASPARTASYMVDDKKQCARKK